MYRQALVSKFKYIPIEEFDPPEGSTWQKLYGGVTFDAFFGITQDGELWREASIEGRFTSERVTQFQKFSLKDFQEGVTFKVGQTKDGKLAISYWSQRVEPKILNNDSHKQFAIIRRYAPRDVLQSSKKISIWRKLIGQRCGLRQYLREPWKNYLIGINEKDQLTWAKEKNCELLRENVTKIELTTESVENFVGFRPVLKIWDSESQPTILSPYQSQIER